MSARCHGRRSRSRSASRTSSPATSSCSTIPITAAAICPISPSSCRYSPATSACSGPSSARIRAISAAPPMAPTIPAPPRSGRKGCASRRSSSTRPAGCARICSTCWRSTSATRASFAATSRRCWARRISASGGVSKLFSEFGAPVVEAAIEAILDATEQQTRAVVSTWKDGVFHGEAFLDDDGHGRTRHPHRAPRSPRRAATSRSICRSPIRSRPAS